MNRFYVSPNEWLNVAIKKNIYKTNKSVTARLCYFGKNHHPPSNPHPPLCIRPPALSLPQVSFEVFVNTTVEESVPVEVVCLGRFLLLQSAESFNVQLYHISGLAELSYHSKKLKNT